jgi:hypothetical protein
MKRARIQLFLLLAVLPLAASGWELQFAAGPWTLQPVTSPVERLAEKIVAEEARDLLAPLLGEFTIISFQPQIDMRSRGNFFSIGLWRRLAAARFAVGMSASYLRFSLPFSLRDEQSIYYQGIPVATITTSGAGRIDLRTLMLTAQGRWRAYQRGRTAVYASAGLAALRISGDLRLPLAARVRSILGDAELSQNTDVTLDELRAENDSVPAWSVAPVLGAALHYRVGAKSRLFLEVSLSQGSFLAAGISLDI